MIFHGRNEHILNDNGTECQTSWKPIMVAALTATEKALEGLPIPAAKTCISLVLKVIEAADVAADNEKILRQLHARYQDLKDFSLSMSSDIPKTVQDDVNDLDAKLKRLAERWEPRLTRKSRKRDIILNLLTASDYRDMLKGFVTETDQAINDFLLRFGVQTWIITYREIVKNRQIAVLSSMNCAQYAPYNSLRADRAELCLQGTRQMVLMTTMGWAQDADPDRPPIFWLNGLAGIGKTTIAHTIASLLDEKNQLAGSFFFLRSDDYLKDARLVFPTLALQLSEVDPLIRTRLVEVLENDPGCVTRSLLTQFDKLILDPISAVSFSKPLILVLDALDECQPSSLAAEILHILVSNIQKIPFLRVFMTSRPEAHFREALGIVVGDSVHQKLVLHENIEIQEEVEEDIRLYLKTSLQKIWNRDQPGEWPSAADLETLVQQSGKLFIYAATTIRFIGGNRSLNVDRQLRNLLKLQKKHAPNTDVEPYMHLDQLYLTVLETALATIDTKDTYYSVRFHDIVGSIVLMQKALPAGSLAAFLGNYDVADIKQTLYYLHSIFIVPDEPSQALQTYHLSFPNFITNPERCTNSDAYIDPQKQERYLFLRCLHTMKRFFGPHVQSKRRPTAGQDTVRHVGGQDVDQLSNDSGEENDSQIDAGVNLDKAERDASDDFYEGDLSMTPEVRYSNNHWCSHLIAIRIQGNVVEKEQSAEEQKLVIELEYFLAYHLSQWLERRIGYTLLTVGATKLKLAQDTFDIMYNAHRWVAANTDSQGSRRMKQIIKTNARGAFARLFPRATGKYILGARLGDQDGPSGKTATGSKVADPTNDDPLEQHIFGTAAEAEIDQGTIFHLNNEAILERLIKHVEISDAAGADINGLFGSASPTLILQIAEMNMRREMALDAMKMDLERDKLRLGARYQDEYVSDFEPDSYLLR
ncbi:hypothetical protein D9619_003683 [Psilocybe cf. subviscida]|uniref:NACHT domain-containing protein n=1 Tax=Psilocybe cf. subviscida TaxID=2480587 RepID=A0A8H5AWI5_9AGAR|nr:hypothetical protein D9619_003683 [Psilocybe cf. subviscida]